MPSPACGFGGAAVEPGGREKGLGAAFNCGHVPPPAHAADAADGPARAWAMQACGFEIKNGLWPYISIAGRYQYRITQTVSSAIPGAKSCWNLVEEARLL